MTADFARPLQRNLRKIPPTVRAKLQAAPEAAFVAGVVHTIPLDELRSGTFAHLNIGIVADGVSFSERVWPRPEMGPYSTKNREGWEVVRRDLPMVTRTFPVETPNFGDWSKGSHTIYLKREVYQRDYFDPPDFQLGVELLGAATNGRVVFKIFVEFPLDRSSPDFEDDLLFALNLLQESVGAADILPADAVAAELLATLTLDWEVFPPGTIEEVVQRTMSRMGRLLPDQQALVRERIALFHKLKPQRFIQGRGGMNRYVGALFADDLVVFENVRYGNALYVLYDDWHEISQRSRVDLLKARDANFDRFVHRPGWQDALTIHIRKEKRRRGIQDGGTARVA